MSVFEIPAHYNLQQAIGTVSAPLNPKWIEQRKQGTATLSYIGGHIVIRLLNQAFNYQWSFEVVKEEIIPSVPKPAFTGYGQQRKAVMNPDGTQKMEPQPPVVKVLGRLTVPGLGVKEQYGSKVLIGGATEQESAFKSASTDALKKCASLFGIGLDLYGEAEGFENQVAQDYAQAPAPQTAPVSNPPYQAPPVQQPAPQAPAQPTTPPATEQYQTASQAQAEGNLAAQQGGGTILKPNVQEAPAQPSAETSSAARTFAWPPSEVQALVGLKAQLGVENNDQLNPYVREFLNNPDVTVQNVTPDNITAFNVFLRSKLA
jgi:hypothetical protein